MVAEDDGEAVAYSLGEQGWLEHSEWYARPYEIAVPSGMVASAGRSLLGALGAEARKRRAEWLELELPPDAALLSILRTVGYTQETVYSHNQGGMGRIVNLSGLAAAIAAAVRGRAQSWEGNDELGRVVFVCDSERAEIDIGTGRVLTISLPQQNLLQLFMGYRSIAELRLEYPACVADYDVAVVDALFPRGYPYMWNLDHF